MISDVHRKVLLEMQGTRNHYFRQSKIQYQKAFGFLGWGLLFAVCLVIKKGLYVLGRNSLAAKI